MKKKTRSSIRPVKEDDVSWGGKGGLFARDRTKHLLKLTRSNEEMLTDSSLSPAGKMYEG
jgi:hypothetical protein